uniref:Uncharacterized protein n=1 Tax=Capra hircus TaxID=9925 RepID=A0A8C2SIT4_CAPHI
MTESREPLLPNHLMELLHSCQSEEDKKKCENSEYSGLERILERHQFPREINLTPKPSSMPLWRRRQNNSGNQGWKKCRLWSKGTREPPTSTIVIPSFSRKRSQLYIFPLSTNFTVPRKLFLLDYKDSEGSFQMCFL